MSEVNPAVAALIARYRTAPAAEAPPNVNPPEAAKVLEEQTAPEVAGVVAPTPEPEPAPAPEPPKAKRGPGRPPKAAAPAPEPAAPVTTPDVPGVEFATTEQIIAELRDRGYRVTLEER